jgi:phosphate transport system substrate-binding protein
MKRILTGNQRSFFSATPLLIILFVLVAGCGPQQSSKETDTADDGTIYVSADESFKPVIDSQVQVYESSHPDAHVVVNYKPEAECLKDFATDSVRMIIATRKYSEAEENFMIDSMKVLPSQMTIAYDAIAVVVNPSSPDSLFTMDELKAILKGKFKKKLIPIFDGTNATSTVRFIIDSVLKGDSLTPEAAAAKTSEGVINYVADHKDAVGFIGVSWIGNKDDPQQISFLRKVKVAQIESVDKPGLYIYPVQANIYAGRYPMIRRLIYILKENHSGLGHGFAYFMSGERGQLIFRRAYLVPARMQFNIRKAVY